MNIRRGLWRIWVFLTVAWLGGFGCASYFLLRDELAKNFQWVLLLRKDAKEPWKAFQDIPLYGFVVSPAKDQLPVKFATVGFQYLDQWNRDVSDGKTLRVAFPDGSKLYLSAELTDDDRTYISKAFWDQRWQRWASVLLPYLGIMFGPPLVLFVLGGSFLWIGRGFARD